MPGPTFVFHIARLSEWQRSEKTEYRPSSLADEGFIHCSTAEQVLETSRRHFAGQTDLILLKIDLSKLRSTLKFEPSSGGESFPHIYGPIRPNEVVEVIPFIPPHAGSSVFSKIMRGELPSYKLHEDAWTYSLLTREPIQLGHALVVPKLEINHFSQVPDPFYSAVFQNAKRLSQAIQKATSCGRVGMIIAGWEVPHVHVHLIPTYDLSDFDFKKGRVRSPEENLQIQKAIIQSMGG